MRTQEENKKERKALKKWVKPKLLILNQTKTLSGTIPGTESITLEVS